MVIILHSFYFFSEPRRRQSVCRVGSQIFLFGGTSPHEGPHVYFTQEQLQFMPDNQPKNLIDHNDTYVLDLNPSLRTLCMDFVVQNSHHYNLECLPQGIKHDIDCMTKDNTISEPLKFKGLPLGWMINRVICVKWYATWLYFHRNIFVINFYSSSLYMYRQGQI